MKLTEIYRGESIGMSLVPNIDPQIWSVRLELSTTPNDYKITACYPSDPGFLPVICEEGIWKLHVPAEETERLSEGILLLQITLFRDDIVKMGTFRIAELLSRRSVAGCRKMTIDSNLELVNTELECRLEFGPNVAMNGKSAYELYKEHHPNTELTEEEYAAYPVHAGDAALAAVEKVEQTEERIEATEKVREEAEQGRILSEQERVEAESSRAAAEQGRVRAEQGRESAEILRVRAEQERVAAEASRVQREESRIAAETAREEAEQTRIADEQERVAAESARAAAEEKRQTDTGEAIGKAAAATKEAEDAAAEATDVAGSIVGPQDVLAHSACSLEERIAHLERLLAAILSGEVYIPKLTVRELSVWGADNLIVTGRGAPSRKPNRAGQFYIDIENDAVYHSIGNAAVSDWKIN